jgi:hypothetical protein
LDAIDSISVGLFPSRPAQKPGAPRLLSASPR